MGPHVNANLDLFSALRRFTKEASGAEHCELCRRSLMPEHRHLVESTTGRLVCACDPCAWRFPTTVEGRFRLVPREIHWLADLILTDSSWERLNLPINLAFFFCRSADGKVRALYPSPAGATESLLSLTEWEGLVVNNPVLASLEADVEALLVNRIDATRDYYIAPIDRCYELVGLIRLHWRGLTGGEEVWQQVALFFDRLRALARTEDRTQPGLQKKLQNPVDHGRQTQAELVATKEGYA